MSTYPPGLESAGQQRLLPVHLIDPSPHRIRSLDPAILEGLALSLKRKGQRQPILVRKVDGRYRVVFGEHRLTAAKNAGLTMLWCTVTEDPQFDDLDELELKLTENLHRNPHVDPDLEGQAYDRLLRERYRTVNDLADALGKSTTYISERLQVHRQLDPTLKPQVGKGLTVANAIALSRILDRSQQIDLAREILEVKRSFSTRPVGPSKQIKVTILCRCPTCGHRHALKGASIPVDP